MDKILLFGATGHAGRAIFRELKQRGYDVTAVVRNAKKATALLGPDASIVCAEATQAETLQGICNGYSVVISALGKSVSPNDWSRPSFEQVDLHGNLNILKAAQAAGVAQFIYISALGAEQMTHLTYFRVHHEFSEALKASGLNYIILQPPAIMSSFLDLADMARKGWLFNIGKGDARTNPISERDLAIGCADAIGQVNQTIPLGGPRLYTRREISETIQCIVAPRFVVRQVPSWALRSALPVWRIFNRNMYDKLAFFNEVIHHDAIAPLKGRITLEEYFEA